MSQDNLARFTTYGPNRGLTLAIGTYQFIDGVCTLPAQDAHAAASILCRYHDVCPAHELEQKSAEYDAAYSKQPANPPAPPVPDTSGITLPPEGSEIVLVPAPLSQLVQPPTESETPATESSGASAAGIEQEGEPAKEAVGVPEAVKEPAPDSSEKIGEGKDDTAAKQKEAEAKEAAAKDAAAKAQTHKKPNSK